MHTDGMHRTMCCCEVDADVHSWISVHYLSGITVCYRVLCLGRDDMRSVDETLQPMHDYHNRTMYSATPPARSASAKGRTMAQPNENGLYRYPTPGFMMSPPSFRRIALYHYMTKSRQDFVDKRTRGSGTAKIRTWDEFDEVSRCAAHRVLAVRSLPVSHVGGLCGCGVPGLRSCMVTRSKRLLHKAESNDCLVQFGCS